jgi:hypothetical protein
MEFLQRFIFYRKDKILFFFAINKDFSLRISLDGEWKKEETDWKMSQREVNSNQFSSFEDQIGHYFSHWN